MFEMTGDMTGRTGRQGRVLRRGAARPVGAGMMPIVVSGLVLSLLTATVGAQPKTDQPAVSVKRITLGDQIPPKQDPQPKDGTPGKQGAAPKISVDSKEYDFGEQWVGPTLRHTFKITNVGDATLNIVKVKPSCGCTKAGPHPSKLEPGESGDFSFQLASTKLRGRFTKTIRITTNDPSSKDFVLKLTGKVKRYVDVEPVNAAFGRILSGEPRERVLKVTNNTDQPLEVSLKDPPPNSKFTFDLVETKPGQEYELRVKASPPYTPGRMTTKVELLTNVDKQRTLTVAASALVPERIEVKPSPLLLTPARLSTGRPIQLSVTNNGPDPMKVTDVSIDDPKVTLELNESVPGKRYVIRLSAPKDYVPPARGRTIVVKTDDSVKPVVKVPVRGSARPPRRTRKRPAEELVGKTAPSFGLRTIEGKPLDNAAVREQVTVMNFFAPNCGFCKKQIPRLEKIRQQYEAKGVRFVNVQETMRKPYELPQVLDILKGIGSGLEVAPDPDNVVGKLFKATSFPTMVVLGKSGKVEYVNVGNVRDLEQRMPKQLDSLLDPSKPRWKAPATAAAPPKRKSPTDLIGKPAPSFKLATLEGKPLDNAALNQQVTVMNFFAPNCGFCKKQIPRLEKIRKQYEAKGVRFVNVQETMRKPYTAEQTLDILKGIGSRLEVAPDPNNTVGRLFNAAGFPTMVVLGKSGKVEYVNVGNVADLEQRMPKQLDSLLDPTKPRWKAPATAAKPTKRKSPTDLVGKPAPSFRLATLEGKPLDNAALNKQVTVMNFFAPNCGFCKKQIPRLEKIRQQYEAKGVRFVNVQETMRKPYTPEQTLDILKGIGSRLEVAPDPGNTVGKLFNANGFPTMVVLGKSGKVEYVNVGNVADLEQRMPKQLDSLLDPTKPRWKASATAAKPATPRKRPAELLVGTTAPSFSLNTLEGKPLTNADLTKHVTVMNFFAPNCGFCKKQIPRLEKIRQRYEAKGVRFVNVQETMRRPYTPEQTLDILKGIGSRLEVAPDPNNTIGKLFKATSFPTMVVLGKSGKVEYVNVGNKADLETRVPTQLDSLLDPSKPRWKEPARQAAATPQRPRAQARDMIGKDIPIFRKLTTGGGAVSTATAEEQVTVLNFFAANCPHCKKQIPRLEAVRKEYADKGVRFINVAETMRGKVYTEAQVLSLLKGLGADAEVVTDTGNALGKQFNATTFPTMVVLGTDGKIAAVNVGNVGDLETRVRAQLDRAVQAAKKPGPRTLGLSTGK